MVILTILLSFRTLTFLLTTLDILQFADFKLCSEVLIVLFTYFMLLSIEVLNLFSECYWYRNRTFCIWPISKVSAK